MAYRVEIKPAARRDMDRIAPPYRARIAAAGDALAGNARALGAGASVMTGSTAMFGNGVVNGTCGGASTSSEHSWFWTTCPSAAGGSFTGTTCVAGTAYDTVAYLRSGGTGTDVACNDDGASISCGTTASEIAGALPAGAGLFGFYIDGYAGAEGNYSAAVTRP